MYRNSAWYPDPTAGEAMSKIIKEHKKARKEELRRMDEIKSRSWVYVVSKYAGDTKNNVLKAKRYCRFVVRKKHIPLASHLFFTRFLDDGNPKERQLGLFFGQALLAKCDEVWVFGTDCSEGMMKEIHEAKKLKKHIRYFDEDMKGVREWDFQKN